MRNAPLTAVVEDPAECDDGFGPCGACPSCRPDTYVHVAGKSVERELVAAILKEFGSSPPPDVAVREAVEYLSSGWGESTEASRFRGHVETLLRAVQAPRLTGEQVEAVKDAYEVLDEYDCDITCKKLSAAFPEEFGKGEVGK